MLLIFTLTGTVAWPVVVMDEGEGWVMVTYIMSGLPALEQVGAGEPHEVYQGSLGSTNGLADAVGTTITRRKHRKNREIGILTDARSVRAPDLRENCLTHTPHRGSPDASLKSGADEARNAETRSELGKQHLSTMRIYDYRNSFGELA